MTAMIRMGQKSAYLLACRALNHLKPGRSLLRISSCSCVIALFTLNPGAEAEQAALPVGTTASPAIVQSAEAATASIEEITVTARHRSEHLQNVPIAITAVSPAQLKAADFKTLREIQQLIPSMQIQGFNPRNATLTIRGLGTNTGTTNDGLEQGVGVYIDGVYMARPSITTFDLQDLQRVEVLRGPQGTLFGKNTTAGALNITTNPPVWKDEVAGWASLGNYGYREFDGYINAKLSEQAALRISGFSDHRDGDIHNTTYHSDWNDFDNEGLKAQLLLEPTDDIAVRLIGDWNHQNEEAGFYVVKGILPTRYANGSPAPSFFARAAVAGYTLPPIEPFARETDIDTDSTIDMRTGGASAQVDWTLPGDYTLTSISAFHYWYWSPSIDGDLLGIPIVTAGNLPTHQKQFSQELRFSSPTGQTVDYSGGLYYFWQQSIDHGINTYGSAASKWFLGTAYPNIPSTALSLTDFTYQSPKTASYSGFGQDTWHITPEWSLTTGLRYTWEQKWGSFWAFPSGTNSASALGLSGAEAAAVTSYQGAIGPSANYNLKTYSGNISGTITLSGQFTDDLLGYATYARGFKSAGLNLINPVPGVPEKVRPETLDDYELGLKSELFDHRLILNAALYWENDDNYQATTTTVDPTGTRYNSYISNIGSVRTRGIELDARAALFDGLTATASAAYNDATDTSFHNSTCPYLLTPHNVCDQSGARLAGVSRWAMTVGLEYAQSIGSAYGNSLETYVHGDNFYRTGYYSAINDDPLTYVPSYDVTDLRVGIRTGDDNVDLSMWVKNLFDTHYFNTISVTTQSLIVAATLGNPRTFGTTLHIKW